MAGCDAGIRCLSYAAWNLWQLGYPEQALKRCNEGSRIGSSAVPYLWSSFGRDLYRRAGLPP